MAIASREIFSSQTLRVIVYVAAIGVSWGMLQAQVTQKADKADVVDVARDVKAIRTLICQDKPKDSLCQTK